jgi:hypothetical protein
MKRTGRRQEWALTMFAFGTVVFFPPIISLFDKPVLVLGLPLTFMVAFGVWVILILSIWLGARPSRLRGGLVTSVPEERFEPTLEQAGIPPGSVQSGPDVITQNTQTTTPQKEG